MKSVAVLISCLTVFGWAVDNRAVPRDGIYGPLQHGTGRPPSPLAVRIDAAPDIRSILGSAGKSICADTTGNVAVIYGFTSGNPDNIFQTKIAYSTNRGAAWRLFGPFSVRYVNYRRCYPGIDARAGDWIAASEAIYGVWQEAYFRGGAYVDSSVLGVAFDEGGFPNGSFQRRVMPGADSLNLWLPCVAVRPDNRNIVYATAVDYDFGAGAGTKIYGWVSTDAGYNWSGPILIARASVGGLDAPHIRFGTGGYLFAYFQRDTVVGPDTLMWPYCIESTDNGLTWIPPNGKCFFTSMNPPPYPQYSSWWYNYDCEVINNTPYVVLSPGVPGEHRDRTEFWKASGPIGNRSWSLTLLGGNTPPGQDSIVREVSISAGKDFVRFTNNIAVTGKITTGSGTDVRCWVSNDLGTSWRYLGWLNIPLAAADGPIECAHIPSRDTSLASINTNVWLHFVYWATNSVYYERRSIRWVGIEEDEGTGVKSPMPHLTATPNPFMQSTRIVFVMPGSPGKAAGMRLQIYDASGRVVKNLSSDFASGIVNRASTVTWRGDDDNGNPLPSGTYFVEAATGGRRVLRKISFLR